MRQLIYLVAAIPVLVLLCTASVFSQLTIAIPQDQPSIQAGINFALPGDTVLVSPGTYFEHDLDFQGKAIIVKSSGGATVTTIDAMGLGRGFQFLGAETASSVLEGFTITNGRAPDALVPFGAGGNGGGILCQDAAPRIQDCVIIGNCAGNGFSGAVDPGRGGGGGGIACTGLAYDTQIYSCTISDNAAGDGGNAVSFGGLAGRGGGLFVNTTFDFTLNTVFVVDCLFFNNVAGLGGNDRTGGHGGGLAVIEGIADVRDSIFRANRAGKGGLPTSSASPATSGGNGGAIYNDGFGILIENCLIENNLAGEGGDHPTTVGGAGGHGGGVAFANIALGFPLVANCVIRGNSVGSGVTNAFGVSTGGVGSALYFGGLGSVVHCVIVDNAPLLGAPLAGAIFGDISGSMGVQNSICRGNLPIEISTLGSFHSVDYCNVEGGFTGTGNLDLPPQFVDANNGDYHLDQNSPCIDAGSPTDFSAFIPEDLDGDQRVIGVAADMGVDEVTPRLPGSDDDFDFKFEVDSIPASIYGVTPVVGGELLCFNFESPGGSLIGAIPVLMAVVYPTLGSPIITPVNFPEVHVEVPNTILIFDGNRPSIFGPVLLPPAGFSLNYVAPLGITGLTVRLQSLLISAVATNGFFAASHGYDLQYP
ncbi:MAG: hypothetical protein V3W41_02350 [Planctomycetota bacterium]